MGNEFGHPEWIDFPREGNNWSFQYARRQWSLIENKELRYHYLGDFDRAMISLIAAHKIYGHRCNHVKSDSHDLVLAFERGGLLFVFNFHPVHSYTDYGLAVDAGKYQILLCTDKPEFGGFDRVDTGFTYRSQMERSFGLKHNLKLYLPSRSGMVLIRKQIPRIR
jgi:1,4-alpha-glucan branching enzyme